MTGPDVNEVHEFLSERYGHLDKLSTLQHGGWSSAFGFRARSRDLVVRFGHHREEFEKERVAANWNTNGVPVPEILEVGDAFNGSFVVSQRYFGTKLADLELHRVPSAIGSLFDVLVAMRDIPLLGKGYGIWVSPTCDAPATTWAEYICGVGDRDESRLVDWRSKLALHSIANSAFQRGCNRLADLAGSVPNVRGLVHADLLLNHLIGDHNEIVTVFDWGNAMAGHPLFDVAWILFCIPWFPEIDREYVLGLVRTHFDDSNLERLLQIYQLHIGVASLQYQAFADDMASIITTSALVEQLLDLLI